jgi:hypothetical protein
MIIKKKGPDSVEVEPSDGGSTSAKVINLALQPDPDMAFFYTNVSYTL